MLNKRLFWVVVALAAAALACTKQAPTAAPWNPSDQGQLGTPCPAGAAATGGCLVTPTPTRAWYDLPTRDPNSPIETPTPNPTRIVPTLRLDPDQYTIQTGDNLASIAQRYNVSWDVIAKANHISDPNSVSVGTELLIPAPTPSGKAPDYKIIPDSELVYGPQTILFDLDGFIQVKKGFLSTYSEEVDKQELTGAQIIEQIAEEYSVNPRILLTVLEYRSGWVTQTAIDDLHRNYPMGLIDDRYQGLYKQLSFAAANLNRGFYLWEANAVGAWLLADGTRVPVDSTINAGTAGVQQLMATFFNQTDWEKAVSADGVFATYSTLFGYPFDKSIEPLLPADLKQPALILPFEPGVNWSFTGGPHSGWGDGSGWAAIDFAPPGEPRGCVLSDAWVTAMADGPVVISNNGLVVQDLDGDGHIQTGWSVLYLHIDKQDRVKQGMVLVAGDRIGHPSCEGGVSSGTHVHIARRYNGAWISADGPIPFNLDGWISSGTGTEYDGFLKREGVSIEAYDGVRDDNQIHR